MQQDGITSLWRPGSAFELLTEYVGGMPQTTYRHGAKTLQDVYRKASRMGARSFLTCESGTWTYASLFAKAARLTAFFGQRGITKGTPVAVSLADDADCVACFIALTQCGATAVLAPRHDIASLQYVCGAANCQHAITDLADTGLLRNVPQILSVTDLRLSEMPAPSGSIDPVAPDLPACIIFTSGSTGSAKGAVLSHRNLATGLMNIMLAGAIAAQGSRPMPPSRPTAPKALLRTPFSHISGCLQLLLAMNTGCEVLRLQTADIQRIVMQHRITAITGASDSDIAMLLSAPSEDLSSLRSIAIVGRPLTQPMRHSLQAHLPLLRMGSGYGLTESCGLICAIGDQHMQGRPDAVGIPLPTVELRILRDDTITAGTSEWGHVWLRGSMMMAGYCNAEPRIMPDGWFRSGDIGHIDQDGCLHIIDRADRFMLSNGRMISCREIQEAASSLLGLHDVAAMPCPENRDRLLLVLAASGPRDPAILKDHLSRQFPQEMIATARISWLEEFPRTPSGKIAYATLVRELAI